MAEQKFLVRAGAPSDDVHVDGRAGSAAGAIAHGQVRIVEGCGLGAAPLRFRTAARAGRLTAGLLGGIIRRAGLAVHDAGLALAARLARFPESLRERVVVDLELGDAIVLQKKNGKQRKNNAISGGRLGAGMGGDPKKGSLVRLSRDLSLCGELQQDQWNVRASAAVEAKKRSSNEVVEA